MAYNQFQWYGLMAVISTIRLFVGQQWVPRLIGLGSAKEPGQLIRQYFPDTDFQTNQAHCFISISNTLLGKRSLPQENLLLSQNYNIVDPPGVFIKNLKLVLRSYFADGIPSIKFAADITCLSKRSFQRKLDAEGLNYRDLIARLRFDVAIELMQNKEHIITDISNQLGYSDSTHFSRAFRRIAGLSPHEYIRQL